MYITLTPHLRDYKSKRAVQQDWHADKDFVIACIGHPFDGKPINRSQAIETSDKYSIRYDGLRKVVNVS